jgi:hypothetical protein
MVSWRHGCRIDSRSSQPPLTGAAWLCEAGCRHPKHLRRARYVSKRPYDWFVDDVHLRLAAHDAQTHIEEALRAARCGCRTRTARALQQVISQVFGADG